MRGRGEKGSEEGRSTRGRKEGGRRSEHYPLNGVESGRQRQQGPMTAVLTAVIGGDAWSWHIHNLSARLLTDVLKASHNVTRRRSATKPPPFARTAAAACSG